MDARLHKVQGAAGRLARVMTGSVRGVAQSGSCQRVKRRLTKGRPSARAFLPSILLAGLPKIDEDETADGQGREPYIVTFIETEVRQKLTNLNKAGWLSLCFAAVLAVLPAGCHHVEMAPSNVLTAVCLGNLRAGCIGSAGALSVIISTRFK